MTRTVAISASLLVFSWPSLSLLWLGTRPSFPLLTLVFVLLIGAIVFFWGRVENPSGLDLSAHAAIRVAFAALSAAIVLYALERWVRAMLYNPYRADMLIVLREATRRLLGGGDPYGTYHAYDAPWTTVLPYGPVLWGPFLVPQMLRMDLRVITIIGELFVPAWCGIAATIEAGRGRVASAVAWVMLLAVVVISIDLPQFTLMGHTPVYWPLLPLFAATVTRKRWLAAAFTLGILIAARSTMVTLGPVLLMGIWVHDRSRTTAAFAIVAATVLALLLPFIIWDYRTIWDGMVASYPRIMKQIVWTSTDRGAINTIGVTGWLLAHHWERLVELTQAATMAAVYGLAWGRIRRGASPLPWMGLSLLCFSLTTLWSVYYIYFDVLFLFVAAAIAETLHGRLRLKAAFLTLVVTAMVVLATTRLMAGPYPTVVVGSPAAQQLLREGLAGGGQDGARQYALATGARAAIALPRSSTATADILVQCRPFDGRGVESQIVTAILNGQLLWAARLQPGWQTIRFAAPRSVWWIGFNQLELQFSPVSLGNSGDDPRRTAVAISRVDVAPHESESRIQ
ncbi:MAG TPA: hypothetical protein VF332_09030 [Vicinamibacterales bacterium]